MAYNKSKLIRLEDYGITYEKKKEMQSRLDKNITCPYERARIVKQIMEVDYKEEFLNLSEKGISNLNSTDSLSNETQLLEFFEVFTNYIDFSKESKAIKKKQSEINKKESWNIQLLIDSENTDDESEVETVLDAVEYDMAMIRDIKQFKKGMYLQKKQDIFEQDFDNEFYGQVLKDYQESIDIAKERLIHNESIMKPMDTKTKEYTELSRESRRLRKILKSSKEDQIEAKNRIGRLVEFKRLSPNSEGNDWWKFANYDDPLIIKALLKDCFGKFNTDKGMIQYDIDNLIKLCKFTDEELDILKHFRAGQAQVDIAKDLNKTQQHIYSKIDTMCNRITKAYKETKYNYVMLNYYKPIYKLCNCCNEIKFERDFYGIKNVCKTCYNKPKK